MPHKYRHSETDKRILRMIRLARKYPKLDYYKRFKSIYILDQNKDWDWRYEENKCKWAIGAIEINDPGIPRNKLNRMVMSDAAKLIGRVCFYEEFAEAADDIYRKYLKHDRKYGFRAGMKLSHPKLYRFIYKGKDDSFLKV